MRSHITLIIALFFITSCAVKVDESKAKMMVESLLNDLKNENYSSLNTYYSDLSNESEPLERKIEKYSRLKEVTGAIQSFELISSKQDYDSDKGINQLQLKYKVNCEKITVEETFLVIRDEGKEKIIYQNIENMK